MTRFFGGLLLGLGILIATLSGLCSLYFAFLFLVDGSGGVGDIWSAIGVVLLFGGIPFLIGFGLIFAGRVILRNNPE
jgi:hypothetical protein